MVGLSHDISISLLNSERQLPRFLLYKLRISKVRRDTAVCFNALLLTHRIFVIYLLPFLLSV